MAEQLESKTAIMLDQAQVDAAEAAADAQENGENGEHIGRRPSSSGRDSKRHRKSFFVCRCLRLFSLCPSTAERGFLQMQTLLLLYASFTAQSALALPYLILSLHSISSCCATSSDAIRSTPTHHNT
jgi:hypothetical protein